MNFIVTQLKNEKLRIEEWVKYHLKNGFDKIIIYLDYPTDGSDDLVKNITQKLKVEYFYTNHGVTVDYKSPNDYAGNVSIAYALVNSYQRGLNYIKETHRIGVDDWVAFIDVDEFIVKTGSLELKDFLCGVDDRIDRLYIPSYDMKCPIDLNMSVVKQSLYRWSDDVRNNSIFNSRGKMISRIYNLFKLDCAHCLDSNVQKTPSKKTKVMSTGGNLIRQPNSVVVDFFHEEEYFKLFHYRNDGMLQQYDEYDDSALRSS